jgi:hypothetical protein
MKVALNFGVGIKVILGTIPSDVRIVNATAGG